MTSRLVFDQKERIGAWVAKQVEQTALWGSFYAMGIERDGEIIAGIVFNNFNGHNATCHIAIAKWSRELPELLENAANYAFVQCGLSRLTGLVDEEKRQTIAFDKHLGWEEECVMKKAASDGGDLHVLVMWPEKCRWLKKKEFDHVRLA